MSTRNGSLPSVLIGRATLALFGVLTAGWFLPKLAGSFAYAALPLYLPAHLVSMVTYDGLLGLEQVVYALESSFSVRSAALWDAGLVVTYYLFAVLAAALSRPLEHRFGPGQSGTSAGTPSVRYTVAAGLLLVGLLLVAQGVVAQPTMTSVACTDSSSASESGAADTPTGTPECTTTTEKATGAQLYIVGLGTAVGLLGAGVVVADRRLAARA